MPTVETLYEFKILGFRNMKMTFIIGTILLLIFWVSMVRKENISEIQRLKIENQALIDKCISRGIKQYIEFDDYPIITTTGQHAEDVAIKACNRDATTYGTKDEK